MVELTSKNFDTQVLHSIVPVLVLWGLNEPNSNAIALQMIKLDASKVKSARVDINQQPQLVMRFSVRDVPLLVLFVQGMAMIQDTFLSDSILKQVT